MAIRRSVRELEDVSEAEKLTVLLEVKKGEAQLAEESKLSLVIHAKASPSVPQENMKDMEVSFSLYSSNKELKI